MFALDNREFSSLTLLYLNLALFVFRLNNRLGATISRLALMPGARVPSTRARFWRHQEDVDPETFEEFIETEEEYVDHIYLFETDVLFESETNLVKWARKRAKTVNTYLIITRYLSKRRFEHRPEGKKIRLDDDDDDQDEKEEVPVKHKGPYETKKCNCPFQLKEETSATEDNWKLYIKDVRHNHKIDVYPHAYA
ncbi:hypothetical protein M9H77_02971 [Catharanthus roseus]|uniref:Uncharacterized protein n=1 Tax=Catharanthus roseus TaxID=4058 RepID=A0ACC0C9U5_CATRO|nr:hypothetical protein M9H77_02971 [Catharanthus roseus]